MSVSTEAVLALWTEQREQMRQSESQRAVLTNYVLVIAAGLSGLVAQQRFAPSTIPVCVLIILLGLYGALSAAKYGERANYHLSQARALVKTLVAAGVLGPDTELDDARQQHYRAFPRLYKIRLHWLWTGLHMGVAGYGVFLLILTLT